jgi:hypothetical protein
MVRFWCHVRDFGAEGEISTVWGPIDIPSVPTDFFHTELDTRIFEELKAKAAAQKEAAAKFAAEGGFRTGPVKEPG